MTKNANESPRVRIATARVRWLAPAIAALASFLIVGLFWIGLSLPPARTPSMSGMCRNHLSHIASAIGIYERTHGTLPPAYTVDAEGNRLHSWRTLILPYLEYSELFESIDLSKPWDDSANAAAREAVIDLYRCPSATHDEGLTTYLGVFGDDCVFSGPEPREIADVTDGTSKTLLVVDVHSDQAVHWMSPYDVSEEALLAIGSDTKTYPHRDMLAVYVDSHLEWIPLDLDRDKLRAMLTIAGGEEIGESAGE